MSTFTVPIKRIRAIEPHPNADAIEFAVIDGYRSIIKKGEFQTGELVAYLPEASLLPPWLLKRLGFWDDSKGCGTLSGNKGDRVKAIRLRGQLSQGICYRLHRPPAAAGWLIEHEQDGVLIRTAVSEGDDVAALLGITKYEPPVPTSLSGEVFSAGTHLTIDFDVENWQSYPNVLAEGEEVVFTEKLHGTLTGIAILPYREALAEAFGERKNILIFSKGLGAKGLVFKNNEKNRDIVYVRATQRLIAHIDERQRDDAHGPSLPIIILGETFGPGVQDLPYDKQIGLRVFAIVEGYRGQQSFLNWDQVVDRARQYELETVPVLYRGPFSIDAMRKHTDGKTLLAAGHMREGIVITPAVERTDPAIGRVCLKSVSADYLTRKGGTEYN